jgi:putrescine transport system substrate-binding protein
MDPFILRLLLTTIFLMLIKPHAATADDPESVLNIYNWADYVGENTLAHFEAEFDIKVNYDTYDNSQIVDAKLMAGNTGYDVVFHGASNSAQLIPIGIFLPLDKTLLPNWKNLDSELLNNFAEFDPGNLYGFPYMWGTTGFSYNHDMLLERMPNAPFNSADLVFDPVVVARFADCGVTLIDSASEVLGMAMMYLGYDANSIEPTQLKEAETLLRKVRPYIKYFSSSKLLIDLPSQEVCIAQSWSGDYAVANRRADDAGIEIDLRFNIPMEGSLAWFDVAFIPADAANISNAHIFLNYLMRPEVIADITNNTGYANVNHKATRLVDRAIASDPAIYPDKAILNRLSTTKVLHPKLERLKSRTWTRIKSGL